MAVTVACLLGLAVTTGVLIWSKRHSGALLQPSAWALAARLNDASSVPVAFRPL